MQKHNSKYTVSELDDTITMLNNSWIQVAISGGTSGKTVSMIPGKKYIGINKIAESPTWTSYNNASYSKYTRDVSIQYRNYDLWIVSCSSRSNSWIKCTLNVTANHTFYLQAFIDGINSNNISHGIEITDSTLSYNTTSLDAINVSLRGTITSATPELRLKANASSTSSTSEVHFGRLALIDLTDCFGAGNEPDKEWCDNHIDFYHTDGKYHSAILIDDNNTTDYDSISGIFDNNGECLISLPGFGTWTASSITEYTDSSINVYNQIEVNEVRKYYITMQLPSSIPVTISRIDMSSLPSGDYAYVTVNSDTTQYTSGNVNINKGNKLTLHFSCPGGNCGVYLHRRKQNESDWPDYYTTDSTWSYVWDTASENDFSAATIEFQYESSGQHLNAAILLT